MQLQFKLADSFQKSRTPDAASLVYRRNNTYATYAIFKAITNKLSYVSEKSFQGRVYWGNTTLMHPSKALNVASAVYLTKKRGKAA